MRKLREPVRHGGGGGGACIIASGAKSDRRCVRLARAAAAAAAAVGAPGRRPERQTAARCRYSSHQVYIVPRAPDSPLEECCCWGNSTGKLFTFFSQHFFAWCDESQ